MVFLLDLQASVASNETVRKPLPFSARWIAPRMLQGLAGQIYLHEPFDVVCSHLIKEAQTRRDENLLEIFYS